MFSSFFSSANSQSQKAATTTSSKSSSTIPSSPRKFMAADLIRPATSNSTSLSIGMFFNHHNGQDKSIETYNPETEPIKAYLRLRPPSNPKHESPYIQILGTDEVSMKPPKDSSSRTRARQSERFKFTSVFNQDTPQEEFFKTTTLPLVKDVLNGENALIFAYGVTNSGKTFSVQGTPQESGILPRSLDVIFNSLDGHHSEERVRPVRIADIEFTTEEQFNRDSIASFQEYSKHTISSLPPKQLRQSLMNDMLSESFNERQKDTTSFPLNHGFEYSVWVSYAEIYNEKIYDLLETPPASQTNGKTIITRKPLSLKKDPNGNGCKYIHGLKEVRIRSVEEAHIILRRGQINRRVFSTLSNRESSRSHGIFTIKLIRLPKGMKIQSHTMNSVVQVSKLSIVDLAGSERTCNTHATGDRLKEAGNINKSLMVLGQCVEIMRLNQQKDITTGSRRKPAIVPFRHSKLTELFQSAFVGNGKAVMIVNVNPYDTGYDENLNVMKFSSVAKEISTIKRHGNHGNKIDQSRLKSLLKLQGEVDSDLCSTIVDDDSDFGSNDVEVEDEDDGFVNSLLERIEELHEKWLAAEQRCVDIELETRQEVTQTFEDRISSIEQNYIDRLQNDASKNAEITDQKLDLLSRRSDSTELEDFVEEQEVEIRFLEEKIKEQRRELDETQVMLSELSLENETLKKEVAEVTAAARPKRGRASQTKTTTKKRSSVKVPLSEQVNQDSISVIQETPTKRASENFQLLATPATKLMTMPDFLETPSLTTTTKKKRKLREKKSFLEEEVLSENLGNEVSRLQNYIKTQLTKSD